MSRNSNGGPNQFSPNGCPIIVEDNRQCGETQTLEIINEFKNLYETKMRQIDSEAGGDCLPGLQAKIHLQQEWIRDLTEQNEMLVRAVEELELEATDRVAMLEEKLRNSAQCGAEVVQKYRDFNFSINLDETFQKLVYLQNDVRNLLEFIRRARDENTWNIDGLQFYDVTYEDIFGASVCVTKSINCLQPNEEKMKLKLQEKEAQLNELEIKLSQMPNQSEVEELSSKLKQRNEDLNSLKRSMLDMRNALTIEVAEKHDVILSLRRDIQQLEEQCRQSNKQTQFRDDIIKELRKEKNVLKEQEHETSHKLFHHANQELVHELSHIRAELHTTSEKMLNSSGVTTHRTSCQSNEHNVVDKEIAEIRQMIDNDCSLFFELGKEINTLLQNIYEKDKELATQTELIGFLTDRIMFLHKQLKDLQSLSIKYKLQTDQDDFEELKKKMSRLEEENRSLKEGILQAKRDLEQLNSHANEYLNERDNYKRMHEESLHLLDTLSANFSKDKQEYERRLSVNTSIDSAELDKKQEVINKLQKEVEAARKEVVALNAENKEKTRQIENLREKDKYNERQVTFSDGKDVKNTLSVPSTETTSWYTTDSEKSGTEQLEETIEQLSGTVNKMMEKSKTPKHTHQCQCVSQLEGELKKALNERGRRNQEMCNLKQTIVELEKALHNMQVRADNLQKAVDLYQNSVNVLEASEERSRIEISQLRATIVNLQEALVAVKQQLDEVQQKAASEIQNNIQCVREIRNILDAMENWCLFYYQESTNSKKLVEHLRDINLDLEVENFGYTQDIAILETRLLKYQHRSKTSEDLVCSLKAEILNLRAQNRQHIRMNFMLKQQMTNLSNEFQNAQQIIEQMQNIQQSCLAVQDANSELQLQLEAVRQELIRETKINEIDAERIEELHQLLGQRTLEMNKYVEQYLNTQKKLDATLHENQTLKNEVLQVTKKLEQCEQTSAIIEERTDYCQKEIEIYRDDLSDMKNKLIMMKDLLQKKNEQYNQLEARYCIQTNTLDCLRKQSDLNKSHFEQDTADLRHTIEELNDKLTKTENDCRVLLEDYKKSQVQVVEMTIQEAKFQQETNQYEQDLTQKLQKYHCEEIRLKEGITQLESEVNILKTELVIKSRQIELAKAHVNRLKSSTNNQVAITQEEVNVLKNEINKMVQEHNALKEENEKLRIELSRLRKYEQQTGQQLDQCLAELHASQAEQDCVIAQNQRLSSELKTLQAAYRELNTTNQRLTESVTSLEQELSDSKNNRDELCVESRNVIDNVRAWLQNQTLINNHLTQKVKNNNNVIKDLKQHISVLEAIKCRCKARQRGGNSGHSTNIHSQKTSWNLGSRGSESASPASSLNSTQEWYTYEECEGDCTSGEESPQVWIRRVESITEELQKSNKYWRSKMLDNDYMVTRDK